MKNSISWLKRSSARWLLLAASMLLASAANAQIFESTAEQVPLIELYTSEGCSSCPPADRWLSGLKAQERLWTGFVPMAFHVDYWDYIGWKDPFASQEYSQRQRRYAREYQESTVYTPGVRKSGDEWRAWRLFGKPYAKSAPEVGKLMVEVNEQGRFSANFASTLSNQKESQQLNIAILGLDLSTEVKRGENAGRTLKHDFVVLGIASYSTANDGQWQGELPAPKTTAERYALAAWITAGGSLKPLQATGGYLSQTQW